ncbi:hypothetical protein NliqN6_1844 [Naganishia liquefaciens]|uniref:Uncharacterized protein n=1 Tax=Naganishia liquefaciens TaxID=104408 RepID=A0A8H3TQM9_9TREE|nr:hypothetical protein NliqN6_1844 [Naganishia liquefaciens]
MSRSCMRELSRVTAAQFKAASNSSRVLLCTPALIPAKQLATFDPLLSTVKGYRQRGFDQAGVESGPYSSIFHFSFECAIRGENLSVVGGRLGLRICIIVGAKAAESLPQTLYHLHHHPRCSRNTICLPGHIQHTPFDLPDHLVKQRREGTDALFLVLDRSLAGLIFVVRWRWQTKHGINRITLFHGRLDDLVVRFRVSIGIGVFLELPQPRFSEAAQKSVKSSFAVNLFDCKVLLELILEGRSPAQLAVRFYLKRSVEQDLDEGGKILRRELGGKGTLKFCHMLG